ncbi:MAG: hypothetical protein KBT33_00400 [Prevotellaceae bacterium]|nr:hypothetical protein [Candidatus Minthosoma equi]
MDRFGIVIERQEQLEALIKEWGFLPFFRNGIPGFSIEEMTPPELLFGYDMENGPWQWKGPIIGNWESAYGKFFQKKAGYVSMEWLPDFMNWRRSQLPLKKETMDARHIHEVLVENESMLSKQLKVASGFTLSRKKNIYPAQNKLNHETAEESIVNKKNGMAFDGLIAQLQMGTHVCIADFEYLISKKGEPYGWEVARYCTPEAMYPDLFPIKDKVEGRTPKQSRERIIDHLKRVLPDVENKKIEKLI